MPRLAVFAMLLAIVIGMWVATLVGKRIEHVARATAPPAARRFESLGVVVVGSGGTFESPLRLGPCIALGSGEEILLVDAGRGVAEALRAAAIPAEQPGALLLTSLLPENVVGIDDLLAARALTGQTRALRVWGPPGSAALVAGLASANAAGLRALLASFGLPAAAEPEVVEVDAAGEWSLGPLRVRARALPGGALPALAYRVEAASRAVVVSGTGHVPETLEDFGRGADVLVHEALYGASLERALEADATQGLALRREAAAHLRLEDAGSLAARMGVRTLALVRLRPPPAFAFAYGREAGRGFRGRVVIAADGETITP